VNVVAAEPAPSQIYVDTNYGHISYLATLGQRDTIISTQLLSIHFFEEWLQRHSARDRWLRRLTMRQSTSCDSEMQRRTSKPTVSSDGGKALITWRAWKQGLAGFCAVLSFPRPFPLRTATTHLLIRHCYCVFLASRLGTGEVPTRCGSIEPCKIRHIFIIMLGRSRRVSLEMMGSLHSKMLLYDRYAHQSNTSRPFSTQHK
jgi:hypothetical protein